MAFREIENMAIYSNSLVLLEVERRKYMEMGYSVSEIELTSTGEYRFIVYGR